MTLATAKPAASAAQTGRLTTMFGSQTGNAERVAEQLACETSDGFGDFLARKELEPLA